MDRDEIRIKNIEYTILLILGKAGGNISMLQLQKAFFYLWELHPEINKLLAFIRNSEGMRSYELEEAAKYPYFLDNCWRYSFPKTKVERVMGGNIKITKEGWKKYNKLVEHILNEKRMDELIDDIRLSASIRNFSWSNLRHLSFIMRIVRQE